MLAPDGERRKAPDYSSNVHQAVCRSRKGILMKPMTARQAEAWIKSRGCVRSHGVGSHRGWINPANGKYTVIPFHGNKTLPQGTLVAIFNQLGIEKPKR